MKKLGSKHCELNVFPVKVIHDNKEIFAEYFVHIVNKSLTTANFHTWKCAMIRPLMKKVNAGTVDSNYRPVSNFENYLSKILECLALTQVACQCVSNKLLPNNQSAYCMGFSCETLSGLVALD